MKYLLFSFSIIFNQFLYSQSKDDLPVSIIPPSPNASQLLEFANTPVNFYTGNPQMKISILFHPGNRLSREVSLEYYVSGIKVEDRANWLGLGWNLNAGRGE
ncbi:MAG: hypothetical protein JXR10_02500 [Cyclobacteriaceae bacterium]